MPTSTVIRPPQTAAPTAPCACRSLTRHHFGVCAKLTASMSLRGVGGCDFEGPPSGLGPPNPCTDASGTAGDRRCVRYLRDRLLSSVLNHTPGPPALSYRTPPYDTKLQATRARGAGTGRRRRVPRLPADRVPHPAEPLHTGQLAADAARVVVDEGCATLPTCPNCDEPALLNLLREATQKGPTT